MCNQANGQMDTRQLLERYRQGNDPLAARQLYEAYAGAMYNICLRMLNDVQLAEDTLQDAFYQVFKSLHTFRGESTLGAWIKSIVVNRCLNQLKKKKHFFMPVDEMELTEEEPVDEKAHAYTVARVQDAIRKLPDGYRVVLSLYLFEGYSHKAIAAELGISESTAKTQYLRAKAKVRQWVQETAQAG
ncbi:sigma-70 family RNA polymerase sigma factor [Compostibacter hankyongensis]|uniref:RNA polymerase sigma factor n=1 Tax=Compostibacter hankyongensis TaxID=1007089 RepID=A0ABP8FQA1_9BACT